MTTKKVSKEISARLSLEHDATGRPIPDLAAREAQRLGDGVTAKEVASAVYNYRRNHPTLRKRQKDRKRQNEVTSAGAEGTLAAVFRLAETTPGALLRVTTVEVVMPVVGPDPAAGDSCPPEG